MVERAHASRPGSGFTAHPHPVYTELGADRASRAEAYRDWLHASLATNEFSRIRACMTQEKAPGDTRFQAMVEKTLDRFVVAGLRRRPRRESGAEAA